MKNILVLSASLGLTCLVAALILIYANDLTYEAREQARLDEEFAAMRAVFPNCEFSETMEPIEIETEEGYFLFYPARINGQLKGFAAFGTSHQGYGGAIRTLVGIEVETDTVRKVAVVKHAETPGLGSRVAERQDTRKLWDLWQPQKTEPEPEEKKPTKLPTNQFLDQFDGRSLPEEQFFQVVTSQDAITDQQRDLAAVSGATISSQAVTKAVGKTLRAYSQEKDLLMDKANKQE